MKQPYFFLVTLLFGFTSSKHTLADYSLMAHAGTILPELELTKVDSISNSLRTRFVFVITTDGLRWQEVFGGADSLLLHDSTYLPDVAAYRANYWAATPAERRTRLMPFFWNKIAQQGQLHGNRTLGSQADVTNSTCISYPGYNEMLTGKTDNWRIFCNQKWTNRNRSVLEYLGQTDALRGKVAACGTWDAFSAILRKGKSGVQVRCGAELQTPEARAEALRLLGTDQCIPPDFYTQYAATQYVQAARPHVMFIGFDDTDSRAHEGKYDAYLDAVQRFDAWLADFWELLQTDTMYRDRTTLLITTDHGRGEGHAWTDHSTLTAGSSAIWLAVLGPDSPPLGEVYAAEHLYQKQLAATIAQLMGYTYTGSKRQAIAPCIEAVFGGAAATVTLSDW
jgi:hypothetical protein